VNRLHQLIDGEPVAMSPTSLRHNLICEELSHRLGVHLRATRSPYRLLPVSAVQPRAAASTNIRIPDLTISPGPFDGYITPDPVVMIEFLSPSNVRETREAVRSYLTIPSAREVLIVDSRKVRAEMLRRQSGGGWPAEPIVWTGRSALTIATIGFSCPLADLYVD
jgi:Uma2 family endonuclease